MTSEGKPTFYGRQTEAECQGEEESRMSGTNSREADEAAQRMLADEVAQREGMSPAFRDIIDRAARMSAAFREIIDLCNTTGSLFERIHDIAHRGLYGDEGEPAPCEPKPAAARGFVCNTAPGWIERLRLAKRALKCGFLMLGLATAAQAASTKAATTAAAPAASATLTLQIRVPEILTISYTCATPDPSGDGSCNVPSNAPVGTVVGTVTVTGSPTAYTGTPSFAEATHSFVMTGHSIVTAVTPLPAASYSATVSGSQ